jgi:enoyl-CoA hydratase
MAELELTIDGGVAVVALARPAKRNAVSLAMQDALAAMLERLAGDAAVRAVVLTGMGTDFCVGGDRAIAQRIDAEAGFEREAIAFHRRTIAALLALPVPVIGAIEGAAFGFGAELVACCDIVLLGETARIADPHVPYGRAPGPVLLLAWPQQASRLIAAELILTAREVLAHEAVALGLANRMVPPGAALGDALAMARAIAATPLLGVAHTIRALRLRIEDVDSLYPPISPR